MQRREFVRYAGFAGLVGLGTFRRAYAAGIKPGPKSALIVVDVQNCFVDRRHAAGQGRRARWCP